MKQYAKDVDHFHGSWEKEATLAVSLAELLGLTKYSVVQERRVGYQFTLHQHPFVQPLMRRLLQRGTPGLQAADTEYTTDRASLPGSVEIITKEVTATVPAGAEIGMAADTDADAGVPGLVALTAGTVVRLSAATAATAKGLGAALVDGLTPTPSANAEFPLAGARQVILSAVTDVTLTAATGVLLFDGTAVTLPAGTVVRLAAGSQLTLPGGLGVKLVKSVRRPVADLYADFFAKEYGPTGVVRRPYPAKDLDFSSGGAYAVYNWELFFHVPMMIATHLSKNQRFAEAQQWFHYLFDPTDSSDGPTPERFWKVRPFHTTDVRKVEEILTNLVTGADETLRRETVNAIAAWADAPFRPHVIARFRPQAYMYKTVMAYLDNLIAWGDSLFRQDTGEAIDEAMMLYVLAANILGPRPQAVPKKGDVRPQTYANLRADLKQFGTALRDVEPEAPYDLLAPPDSGGDADRLATIRSLGQALYFGTPRNDKLLGYWDTVADRLFKIRNSLNIQGVFRRLALFEPPIDPALLARAAAAGLDAAAVVAGLNQPLPLVRFQLLAQKATELAQEVKGLGAGLLAAMEKEDGEALGVLRAKHEGAMLKAVELVRYTQLQEAIKAKEGVAQTLAQAVQRYTYFERQLGKSADDIAKAIPELDDLDRDTLAAMKFAAKEPEVTAREVPIDIAQDLGGSGGKIVSSFERQEVAKLQEARDSSDEAATKDKIAAGLSLLPELGIAFHFWGIGGSLAFGGSALSRAMSFWASFAKTEAEQKTYESGNAARVNSYARREQDWAYQSGVAAGDITQAFKQLRAAQLREAAAEVELKNHRQQMRQADEVEAFLNAEGANKKGKKTNQALYAWMKREAKGLYAQCFQLAFEVAKKAERALRHELSDPSHAFLQPSYLGGKEGLLAGEKLHLDLKRMEAAYLDLNRREYELTKHVSLLQVDPLAVLRLRATGRCVVTLTESLFDLDGPGHYFRRIKSVAVSVPCVTGPYAGVNLTLTLLKSSVRTTPALGGGYPRDGAEDDRFNDHFGSLQSVVASSGQNDGGLFEVNLRDERFLPFENSGAVSEWQLALPADPSGGEPCQFDYDTISDVILHVRYTAREGGGPLRKAALAHLGTQISDARTAGSVRLFSVRHEFPTEWARFTAQTPATGERAELTLRLRDEHYPFWSKGRLTAVPAAGVLARPKPPTPPATAPVSVGVFNKKAVSNAPADKMGTLEKGDLGGVLAGSLAGHPTTPTGEWKLFFDTNALDDLWLAVTWGN